MPLSWAAVNQILFWQGLHHCDVRFQLILSHGAALLSMLWRGSITKLLLVYLELGTQIMYRFIFLS